MKTKNTLFYKGKRLQKKPIDPTISVYGILKNKTYLRTISLFSALTFLVAPLSNVIRTSNSKESSKVQSIFSYDNFLDEQSKKTALDISKAARRHNYEDFLIPLSKPSDTVLPIEEEPSIIKESPMYATTIVENIDDYIETGSDTLAISDEKIDQEIQKRDIMKDQGWTEEMFDISCAVVLAEAKALSYEDAYGVISTLLNRTNSIKWNHSVDRVSGEGAGQNIYYQIIQPGQFEVYSKELYTDFLPEVFPGTRGGYEDYESITDLPGYQAFLDCLTTKEPSHNFLNFYANFGDKSNKVQLVKGGNLYYNELKPEDKIELVNNKTLALTPTQM